MYTLIKKLCKLAATVGIAIIICGVISGMMLDDFEKNAEQTTAYITTVEEGGMFSNGYKVNLRYTVDGESYTGTINSGNLGESFEVYLRDAEMAGMDICRYIDELDNNRKTIDICYNREVPKSIKSVSFREGGIDYYTWGAVMTIGAIVLAIINKAAKKKREERAAEKRVEKKMAAQEKKNNR